MQMKQSHLPSSPPENLSEAQFISTFLHIISSYFKEDELLFPKPLPFV